MSNPQRHNTPKTYDRRFQRPRTRPPFPDVYRRPKVFIDPMKISNPRRRLAGPVYIRTQQPYAVTNEPLRCIERYDRHERKRPIYYRVGRPPEEGSKKVKNEKNMSNRTDSYIVNNEKLIQVYSPLSDKLKMSSSEDGLIDVLSKVAKPIMKTTIIGEPPSERMPQSITVPKGKECSPGVIPYKGPSYFDERRKKLPEQKIVKTTGLNRSNEHSKNNTKVTPYNLKANPLSVNKGEKEPKQNSSKDSTCSSDIRRQFIQPQLHGTCGICLKYCMIISNITILLGSIIVIIIACVSLHDQSFLIQIIGANLYTNVTYFLIAGACATVLFSLLGCVGAIKEVRSILIGYFVVLCLLFVGMMVGGLSGYLFRSHLYNAMDKNMMASIEAYSENAKTKEAWDIVQENLECCGIRSVNDWPEEEIPNSCCLLKNMHGTCDKDDAYKLGCLEKAHTYLQNNASMIAVAYVMLIFVIVLGMVLSCSLWRMVDSRKRRFKGLSST